MQQVKTDTPRAKEMYDYVLRTMKNRTLLNQELQCMFDPIIEFDEATSCQIGTELTSPYAKTEKKAEVVAQTPAKQTATANVSAAEETKDIPQKVPKLSKSKAICKSKVKDYFMDQIDKYPEIFEKLMSVRQKI